MSPLREDQGGFYETRVLRRADRGPEVYFVCGGPAHCDDDDDDYDGGGDCDYEDDDVGALSSVQCAVCKDISFHDEEDEIEEHAFFYSCIAYIIGLYGDARDDHGDHDDVIDEDEIEELDQDEDVDEVDLKSEGGCQKF